MGLVEKALRKRSNQKLAEPIYATTIMTDAQIIETLRQIVDAHNTETVRDVERWKTTGNRVSRWVNRDKDPEREHYYHLDVSSDGILVGFRRTPERILALGRKSPGFDSYWLAALELPGLEDGTTGSAKMTLLRWVMDGNNGKLKDRGFYEWLVDELFGCISAEPSQLPG